MAKVAVGLFDNFEHARMAVEELVQNGFRREDISLIANDSSKEYQRYLKEDDTAEDIGEGAVAGAGIGAVLGGLGGLLVGLGALAIPGIGPVIAAGPIVAALAGAGIGATAGGLLGALVKAGIPEEEAGLYAEGVRRGGTLVTVQSTDEMANRAVDILNRHNPVDVDKRSADWRKENWQGFSETSTPYTADQIRTERTRYTTDMDRDIDREGKTVLPVMEEELRVGKREVETGGVRVHTEVEETPVEEEVRLREERINVERRPVDRPVSPEDVDAFREGTIDVTSRAEEAVVDKRARVVEEVEISKDVEERSETIRDSVRRTDVDVEDIDRGTISTDFGEFDDYWRQHFNTKYANTSYTYDQYRPYYRYGYEIANDTRFRNRTWDEIEMDVRHDWESSFPGKLWDDFKDAVREGWYRVTGRL